MYVAEYLIKEKHQQRLRQAADGRAALQVTELRRLKKRRQRAERQLSRTLQRVEQLRSLMSAG